MNRPQDFPVDPTLPQLAQALDAQVAAEVFADTLRAHGMRVEACVVDRVKYRPRRNCTLSYRLQLRDSASDRVFEQRVAARLCGPGDAARRAARAAAAPMAPSRAGPALRLLPALGMLTWWWPNDAKLRAPHVLGNPRLLQDEVLPEVLAALGADRATLTGHQVEVAQYVPEQRLTARVDLRWQADGHAHTHTHTHTHARRVYAKSSREPDGATAHGFLRALQHSAAWREARLRTPAALCWQPQHDLHWQEALPGQAWLDLPREQAMALAPALGAQLAALHATPLALERTLTATQLHNRLDEVTGVLAQALPEARSALGRLAVPMAGGLEALDHAAPATLHGDLHPRNILADGPRLALIDLDGLRRGPASMELGAWVADGMYRALLDGASPMRDLAAWQALLAGYADAGGPRIAAPTLAWATAWNLLTQRAWRCVVNLKPGRFAIAPAVVALAADLATTHDLELVG